MKREEFVALMVPG